MSEQQSKPKFEMGQVVAIKSTKKQVVFRILAANFFPDSGEWGYQLDRKNWLAEHMLRALTEKERGQP